MRIDRLKERWSLRFDYSLIDGNADVEMRSGVPQEFPSLRTRSHGPSLEVEFAATPALDIVGTLRYEHYDAHDWALEGVRPDTVASVLASGAEPYDHDAKLVGLSFRYRFGGAPDAAPDPGQRAGPGGRKMHANVRGHRFDPVVPRYLEQTYWWAYGQPLAVRVFERQWLINLILWGNFRRLRDAAIAALGGRLEGRTLQISCVYGA